MLVTRIGNWTTHSEMFIIIIIVIIINIILNCFSGDKLDARVPVNTGKAKMASPPARQRVERLEENSVAVISSPSNCLTPFFLLW